MARWRFLVLALLALAAALAGNSMQTGRSAGQELTVPSATLKITDVAGADDRSYAIYSLAEMGYDSDLGKWIAETIPQIIEPGSWANYGGTAVLRYHAQKNILIVNHSAAVQTKVENFLKKLKASLPKERETSFAANKPSPRAGIVPAVYNAPAPLHASNPVPEASSYPVPAPVKPPKHLFHFLIRYEGEGIIDDNVVKYMKVQAQGEKKDNSDKPTGSSADHHLYSPSQHGPLPSPAAPVASSTAPQGTEEEKAADKKAKADKQP